MVEMWALTKLGKKAAGRITYSARDGILDYLYDNKTAPTDQIASATGQSEHAVRSFLRKCVGKGLVKELTSQGGLNDGVF